MSRVEKDTRATSGTASVRAKIEPSATFHTLRHTYTSALAMRGVIAAQLGHGDTRMTEKHYTHFAPSYVADTVRAALPGFGIIDETNVVALQPKATGLDSPNNCR